MSWQDRDYASDANRGIGRPGGDWAGLRPTFDNPITWALTLFRAGGITVRIHIFFVIYIVIMLLRSLADTAAGSSLPRFKLTALSMSILFLIVLIHEFGHVLACRWMRGQADEILMWPLGGLAYCRPPHHWKAHLITAMGGPMMNVIICVITGGMLAILLPTQWLGLALPNPLDPFGGLDLLRHGSWAHFTLYFINELSLILLLFNLLPIFPLDGGRIVQAAFWPKFGWSRSMIFSVRAGFVGAILLGIFGAVTSNWMLVGIALFGGITCYITQKQVQWTDAELGVESDEYALSLHNANDESGPTKPAVSRRAQRQAQREQEEAREVDRILQKIADSGIHSLTRGEKALLKRVTERKRHEQS